MSTPSLYQTQANALIAQLRRDQSERTQAMEREAQRWARDKLRDARHQARLRIAGVIESERAGLEREIAAAEASIGAQQRHRQQQYIAGIVGRVLERVPRELERRWQDAGTRRAWVAAALDEAGRRLGASTWSVRHAPGLHAAERHVGSGDTLTWTEDLALKAGLVIEKPGARLDASIPGLLSDSAGVQGHIVHLLGLVAAGAREHE